MLYVSQLIGAPIRDADGERVATVRDLIVCIGEVYPPVTGLVARQGRRTFFVPIGQVATLVPNGAALAANHLNLSPFDRRQDEILLGQDVLDRQLIDVDGKRVVRVNDLQVTSIEGTYQVIGVDVGARALLARFFGSHRERTAADDLVDWADIEYLAANAPNVRLKVSHDRLARLHPVEIANIIEDLSYHQGTEIVASLDDEIAADTLEELDDDRQADILQQMDSERAADILEEMAPNDAADLLSELRQEKQQELLSLMEPEESDDVRELMEYHEDTAGGMMTTDYVSVPLGLTAGEALAYLHGMETQPDFVYYLYVVEHDATAPPDTPYRTGDDIPECLRGIVTLRQLVVAHPAMPITELMERDLVTVASSDRAEDAAHQLIEYGLYALPVVTAEGVLLGIIAADDAFDRLLPDSWRKRLRIFA